MITVIDLKISNIASVVQALKRLNVHYRVVYDSEGISQGDKLILAGVGSFYEATSRMHSLGLDNAIRNEVLNKNKPILGICLGMQLFAKQGTEGGQAEGLGLIDGCASYHRAGEQNLSLPHIGWNDVVYTDFKIFDSIENGSCFYFVHSYEFLPQEPVKIAYSNYGVDFIAAIQKDNIIGVQFHPEKSQSVGLRLLSNFCEGIY